MFVDTDEDPSLGPGNRPLVPPARNDYPDKWDNHYGNGYNAVFCDGHAEWVRGRDIGRSE